MSGMRPVRALLPVSWLYGLAVGARNRAYDAGLFRARHPGVPVVAVGNITAGGTGKTPLVAEAASILQRSGKKVGIISRGYGRATKGRVVVADGGSVLVHARDGGDEPVMLARRLPGVVVVVAERRWEAASAAVQEFGVDVLVMDDGFQHRAVGRDLDIVVVDGRSDAAREPLLPAGLRREPLSGLRRAQLIAVSKVFSATAVQDIGQRLKRWSEAPVVGFVQEATGLYDFRSGTPEAPRPGLKVFVFSGIGDHAGFLETVRSLGMIVAGDARFADHYRYTEIDAAQLVERAAELGAGAFVTTEKDAVRLESEPSAASAFAEGAPMYVVRSGVRFVTGEGRFHGALASVAEGRKRSC